jgi:thiamine biosynthesis lipoprotein
MNTNESNDRRAFLTGKALREKAQRLGDQLADSIIGNTTKPAPDARDTLRLTARAMACDFAIIMNAGEHRAIWEASKCLDTLEQHEQQMSVYRSDSEISILNQSAYENPCEVEPELFRLLQMANELSEETDGAFDLTSDPLIQLWRTCRDESRLPTDQEIEARLQQVGMRHVAFDEPSRKISFKQPRLSLNLGAIGKGYALDRMTEELENLGNHDFLLHGGRSSLITRGVNNDGGWPVGIGNPLFTDRRLGTLLLKNQALATSGSNIQHFRIGDRRYGHILDPRTGWPIETVLSVTALAPSAAMADALSTAFYVMGIERTQEYCSRHPEYGAIIIPKTTNDRRVSPQVFGVDPSQIYWDQSQIITPESV